VPLVSFTLSSDQPVYQLRETKPCMSMNNWSGVAVVVGSDGAWLLCMWFGCFFVWVNQFNNRFCWAQREHSDCWTADWKRSLAHSMMFYSLKLCYTVPLVSFTLGSDQPAYWLQEPKPWVEFVCGESYGRWVRECAFNDWWSQFWTRVCCMSRTKGIRPSFHTWSYMSSNFE